MMNETTSNQKSAALILLSHSLVSIFFRSYFKRLSLMVKSKVMTSLKTSKPTGKVNAGPFIVG